MKKFSKIPWPWQQTYETPLQDLDRFVAAILSPIQPVQAARVVIDKVVFPPDDLAALLGTTPEMISRDDTTIDATGAIEAADLLRGTLVDWIDFVFIPAPKPFVLYADHDEFTTVFAHTRSNLHRATNSLDRGKFRRVEGYTRK